MMGTQDTEKGNSTSESFRVVIPKDGEVTDPIQPIDPKVERKLVRKIDAYVITILGMLYLLCFLDRGNIGSANVATPSISDALGLTPTQYGAAVSVVYATYVVFEPIWANLLKILTPKILLSFSTFAWGVITIGTAFTKDYSHLIACRVLLGVFEAGLFPCITMYVMMNYRREETGRRMSYIFSCAAFAGAFGGLIGFGLVRIETGSVVGWQYLYIVEGILSLALAPICYFWVPNHMDKAWFLKAHEKDLAAQRYELNKRHFNQAEAFHWSEVVRAFLDWKVYVAGCIQFCADITLYGISTFMPQIIRAMGFTNVLAQLLTVPVYFVGGTVFIIVAHYSDKYQLRGIFIVLGMSLNLIGYIILATVEAVAGRYVGLFIVAAGLYITPGLNVTWISNNTAGHYKRSTAVGLNQLIGNSSGAAIGSIFLSTLAPRYLQSMYISMGLTALGLFCAIFMTLMMRRANMARAKLIAQGALDQPELGDSNPHFKFYL